MKGKISKIKNTKGELALPITTVEAVYLEDGKTKLSDEIKDVLKYEILDDEGITAEIPSVIEEIDGIKKNISEINSSLDNKASELSGRIDNLIALPEGSTTGDAELADIRVLSDGTVCNSAGKAVRTIDEKVSTFIEVKDVSGGSNLYNEVTTQ